MQHALRQFKADIFQALAHPTRIAIVEILRNDEVPAGTIFAQLDVEQANISQHLAVLRAKRIVVNRKVGNQVFYTLRSRRLVEVLDAMRLYFQEHLSEALEMLEEIQQEEISCVPKRRSQDAPTHGVIDCLQSPGGATDPTHL